MLGQCWEMLSDASHCGQLGAWAQQKRPPSCPAAAPFAHEWEGFGIAWLILSSGPPAPCTGHVAGDLLHCSSF